ncbi:MAG TPA: hypothetical protein VHG89_05815 [Verrucomicrobiae bacterium]|nr:hypothetical protein [Verrucomicrobiae bacterium]
MENAKHQYLESIRSGTAYPVYRNFIGILAMLGCVVAGIEVIAALISGLSTMRYSFFSGVGIIIVGGVAAVITYFLVKFFKEAALILADIGDSTLEANSRSTDEKKTTVG